MVGATTRRTTKETHHAVHILTQNTHTRTNTRDHAHKTKKEIDAERGLEKDYKETKKWTSTR